MRETRRKRLTLVATILGSTIVFLEATVVNVALPAISEDLDAGLASQQWVVEAYLLTMVALLLVGGSLGDKFGRKRMFLAGLFGFAVTSVLCAVAPSDELLVAARGLQGMAGALLVPGSLAIVSATYAGAARGAAVGAWTAWTGISTVIGPAGGGALIDNLSWRWIFWLNLPILALTILLTMRVVEESSDPEAVPGIDWMGILLSAVGLAGPVFALIEQPTYGFADPLVWIPMAVGLVCLVLFFIWEARVPHPMLDLKLFRIRNFAVANLTTLTTYAGLYGGFFFVTLFLQQTAGYSALEAGLAGMPVSILLFVLSPRFGRLSAARGPRLLMALGPIVAGIGMLMYLRVDASADYVADVLPAVLVFGVGLAATVAPLTTTVLNSVSEHHAGVASGVNNDVARVAGLLAIAVLGTLISASFGSRLDDELPPESLSPAALEATDQARDKPLGAPDTAGLDSGEADRVAATVTDASTSGFHLGAGIAGALMIIGGLVSAAGIRDPRRGPVVIAPRGATAGDCGSEAAAA